jgi:hypothetical protein
MNFKSCLLLLAFLCTGPGALSQATVSGSKTSQAAASDDKGVVAIQAVISQVRGALIDVQKDLRDKNLPPLASIDLTLKTVAEKDAGGTFKLWIISFGVKREKDQTSTVTIHLTPPSPDNPKPVGAVTLGEALRTAIVSAAEGAQQSGNKDYPLLFSGLTVELEFTVKTTANGGLTVPDIVPITAAISGQVAKNATQTIKVVFQDPKKPGTP